MEYEQILIGVGILAAVLYIIYRSNKARRNRNKLTGSGRNTKRK